jgi:hypothetical protein
MSDEEATLMITSVRRSALIAAFCLLAAPSAAAATVSTPSAAQQRVLAAETLTQFKVTLIATEGSGTESSKATVTAVGYQYVGSGWKKAATKTIGQPDQWYWDLAGVCSLMASQPVDTIRVSLLDSPSSGQCSTIYTEHWGNG